MLKHMFWALIVKATAIATIATIALIGTPAFAADMAVKSAPPAPAPAVYNWTGWYVGVNAGASMGNANTNFNNSAIAISGLGATATFPTFSGSDRTYPDGFIGGGQIGYNWQYSPLIVVGLEADFQGAAERDNELFHSAFSSTAVLTGSVTGTRPVTGTEDAYYGTKIDWFGTVRARLGYVWGNGNVLSYVTGGFAYGKVDVGGTSTITLTNFPAGFVTQGFNHNAVNTGWVLGYGTEGAIDFWGAHNWTWKIESLYMDLGHISTAGVVTGVQNPGSGFVVTNPGQLTTNTHFTDWILRGGVNYKFY